MDAWEDIWDNLEALVTQLVTKVLRRARRELQTDVALDVNGLTESDTDLSKSNDAAVVIQRSIRRRSESMPQVAGIQTQLVLDGFPRDSSPGVIVEQLYEFADGGGEEPIDVAAVDTNRMGAKNQLTYFCEYVMDLIREHSADSRRMEELVGALKGCRKHVEKRMASHVECVRKTAAQDSGRVWYESCLQPSWPEPTTPPSEAESSDRHPQDGAMLHLGVLYLIEGHLWLCLVLSTKARRTSAHAPRVGGVDDVDTSSPALLSLMTSASPGHPSPSTRRRSGSSLQPSSPKPDTSPSRASSSDRQLPNGAISDLEALYLIDEYLWHTEIQDLFLGRQSFARLCESLGSDDIADVVARCLALLVESLDGMDDPVVERGQWLRVDTLMALQYISFGCSLAEDSPCDTLVPLMRSASEMFYHEGVLRCMVLLLDKLLDSAYMLTRKRDAGYLPEDPRPCELLLARELRCCFNIIYVCVLFNLHRPDFTEECLVGSSRGGVDGPQETPSRCGETDDGEGERSLMEVLTFASRFALDLRELPIRKLLLCDLLLWKAILDAPDRWLFLMTPNTPERDLRQCRKSVRTLQAASQTECSVLLGEFPASEPKLKDFQAFVVLCLHENYIHTKHGCRRPTPIREALSIINDYQDRFLRSYAFHAAEEEFLRRNSTPLADIYTRFLSLKAQGLIKYRMGLTRVQKSDAESRFSIQQLVKHLMPNWEDRTAQTKRALSRGYWCNGVRVPAAPPTRRGERGRRQPSSWVNENAGGNRSSGRDDREEEEEDDDDSSSVITSSSEASSNASLDPDVMDAGFRLLRQAADEEDEDDEEPSPEDVISLEDFVHSLPLMGGSGQANNGRGPRGGGGGVKMSVEDVKLMFEGVTRWTSADDHEELLDAVCGDKHHPHSPGEVDTPDAEQPEPLVGACQPGDRLIEKFFRCLMPKLDSLFSTLQQLSLSASKNPSEYPSTIDLSLERRLLFQQQALDDRGRRGTADSGDHSENLTIEELMLVDGATLASASLRRRPREEKEMQRHSDIITAAATGMAVCLLKRSRQISLQLFQSIVDSFCKNNGALVMLKILNGLDETAVGPYDVPPVLPCLRAADKVSRVPWEAEGDAAAMETLQNAMPSPLAESYWRAASVLYAVCRDSPERVRKVLVQFRSFSSLVKMFRTPNRQIQKVAYKLFKKQVRFYPKKLKMNSMSAISTAYNLLPTSPVEDWVLSSPLHAENHRDEGLVLDFTSGATDYAPSVNEFRKYNDIVAPDERSSPKRTLVPNKAAADQTDEVSDAIDPELSSTELLKRTSEEMAEYYKLISLVDWADPECVEAFLQATGMTPEDCFYGHASFDAWLNDTLLASSDARPSLATPVPESSEAPTTTV
ncbi:hypothetical protein FOZ61_009080 [Perkinsus olseni]|uniref:Far11/STRP C-terminal domain-containing protein n=1 Tax=Perkinsus olseni TaxID=32597 RepID=A0A7J6L299_PEROL|nr:hypothetical protein FOZ61_009080 [Perkinsus olseni]